MIRTILSFGAVLLLCVSFGSLAGCDGGSESYEDAPKGGARRPTPSETRTAPGPDTDGESGLNTGGDPGGDPGDG